jgi:hypothetical protein
MKRNYFRKIKRKCNKELKLYYRNMNVLYELFNDIHISDKEDEVFTFIQSMPISEIEKMFDNIVIKFHTIDMADAIYEPIIFKFEIIKYVQKMRNGEEINGN